MTIFSSEKVEQNKQSEFLEWQLERMVFVAVAAAVDADDLIALTKERK